MNEAVKAVGLYVVASRDIYDFIEMVEEETSDEVLKILYQMLTQPNPNQSKENVELNKIVTPVVERELNRRGVV